MSEQQSIHGIWTKRWTFVLAATGSAVGLGNIWKFPYMAGENGGGAFVLIYLCFIAAIGIPVMLAEILLGRRGRASPINSMHKLADEAQATPFWGGIGWLGAVAGMLILSFYSVVAGWAVSYVYLMASGTFTGQEADVISGEFGNLVSDPAKLVDWHTVFIAMTVVVVANGIHKGLEMAVQLLMPLLFIMLLLLLGYSMTQEAFTDSLRFLFKVDFSKLTEEAVLSALGHSFFTLSLGMGAIMAYGAYMSRQQSLAATVVTVGVLDTLVAIVAGMVIFTIVFANGLEPGAGPSLMFQTLPIAFSQMPGGVVLGTMFFVLVVAAAWSSAISLAEPAVAWAVETLGMNRGMAALIVGVVAWVLGVACALSLNIWSDVKVFDETIFDFLDKLTTNIMLPLGGLLICIFVAWVMDRAIVRKEVDIDHPTIYKIWFFLVRFVSPVGVAVVMLNKLME
ncbi:MAG: sodium-dependent transporter [Pseudomonadota bacterium]|nr:sodium-dependent transporter [Pseudomonadota bacterium]